MRTAGYGRSMTMRSRPANCAYAAAVAVILALIVGYSFTLLLTHFGFGIITSPERAPRWPGTLQRAALSYYASQHVMLEGSGKVDDVFGETANVSAAITLPLTVWALVPALGLLLGGFVAGRMRRECGRFSMVAPALIGAAVYGASLAALTPWVRAILDKSTLPAVKGVEFSPPQILFSPSQNSTLVFASIFGFLFLYLGAVLTVKVALGDGFRAKWWNCAKGVLFTVLPLQILLATGLMVWYFTSVPRKDAPGLRFAQMLPSVSGIAYLAAFGADIEAGVETIASNGNKAYPLQVSANSYNGITRQDISSKSNKPVPAAVLAFVGLIAFVVMLSGWLAVRLGSQDGSLPTALRVTIIYGLYLVLLMLFCNIKLSVSDSFSTSIVSLSATYAPTMLYSLGGALVLSFISAFAAGRKYTSLRIGW